MTVTATIFLFALKTLARLDILAWLIGIPLLVAALILLWTQHRRYRAMCNDLSQLSKVKTHSVEYDLVMKAMKLAIWHLDVQTRTVQLESDYRDSNDSLVLPSQATVDDIFSLIDPQDGEFIRRGVRDLMAGHMDVFHTQYRTKIARSEKIYWSEMFATVEKRDLQGAPVSVVGALMRIDQQKEIENALMDAVYHAEESDRLKSAFLANISHEIRTPLNAIVGFSDVLTMVDDPSERRHLIELIKKNNTHLLRIFDDIVSMSKLEAKGGSELKRSTFDLVTVFRDIVLKYELSTKETGVPIVINDPDGLPTLTTDRDRLREILNQYVNNAIKFTTEGQVTMGCTPVGSRYRIWVRDTGKGIPEDMCDERLFERFYKVDEFVPGTGLGLSICRSLAMTMNGEVGVESKLGQGSMFWVELEG